MDFSFSIADKRGEIAADPPILRLFVILAFSLLYYFGSAMT